MTDKPEGLTLDFTDLQIGGDIVRLTLSETKIMRALIDNWGVVVSRKEIERNLWGEGIIRGSDVVPVVIHRIRRKIKHTTLTIINRFGQGYYLTLLPPDWQGEAA